MMVPCFIAVPVLAPVLIAVLMIIWGTLASQFEPKPASGVSLFVAWALNAAGITLALYVFMADTLRVAHLGVSEVRQVLPVEFNWPLFIVALALMAAPVAQLVWNQRIERSASASSALPEVG